MDGANATVVLEHAARRMARPSGSATPWARRCTAGGLFLLGAGVLATPWDVLPAAILLLLAGVIGAGDARAAVRQVASLRAAGYAALAAVAVAVVSKLVSDAPWSEVDNRARLLAVPVVALVVVAARPGRSALWMGAVTGLLVAAALAVGEALMGSERVDGMGAHPLVFATTIVLLLAVAVFCRPARGFVWTTLAGAAACIAIVLSGSRGAWFGVGAIVLVAVFTQRGRARAASWAVFAALAVGVAGALSVPALAERTRLEELRGDVARLRQGDVDSSLGARLTLYRVAARALVEHPLTGVGVGQFGRYVAAAPECRRKQGEACRLGHAHNDLLEWGATMGVPGLLALIALYGVPLLTFVRQWRALPAAQRPHSAPLAGIALVVAFAACGLTQSMFAHQLTATLFAMSAGALLGFGWLEVEAARRLNAGGVAAAWPAPAARARRVSTRGRAPATRVRRSA